MLCSALTLIILVTAQEFYEAKGSPINLEPMIPAPSKGCHQWSPKDALLDMEVKEDFDRMSQGVCATHCLMRKKKYFGLADGRRCFCGDQIDSKTIVPKLDCNVPCFNFSDVEKCGGSSAMEVFDLVPVPKNHSGQSALDVYEPEGAPIDMQPMIPAPSKGCYVWGNHYYVLDREIKEDFKYMSQRVCASHCLMELGSKYFGLADGRLCFCGNKIHSKIIVPKLDCNVPCFNFSDVEKCGGSSAMEVFDLVPVPKNHSGQSALDVYEPEGAPIDMQPMIPAPSKGCYHWGNHYSVLSREIKEDFKYMSQRVCASHCLMELGSKYFGLADGRLCLCGNKIHSKTIVPKLDCKASCFNYLYHKKCGGRGAIEVFDLKPVPKIYSGQSALDVYEPEGAPIDMQPMIPAPSKGCYHWGNGYSVLTREIKEDFKYMSQRVCASHCLMETRWKYFGLADGRRCLCGNKIQSQIIPKYYCNASCFNYLYHKKCGGRGAIEVFDLKPVPKIYSGQSALDVYEPEGAPIDMQPMIPAPSKGCYLWYLNGDHRDFALKYEVDEDFKYMSQRVCATHCLMEKTWKYFGLFDGRRCFCGDEIRSRNVLNLICNVQCYNYLYGEKCGGRDAMEIFDLVPVPKNYSGETA